ncbi:MAG: glycoside hydrolase [Schleiferiaceae bacterium]|nr:glycoside hydrolase [Schleiferiaceae bacterium]
MQRFFNLLLVPFAFSGALAQSDYTNVSITSGIFQTGPCEPSIAILPNDPSKIVVGSVLNGVHYSNDTGLTWRSYRLVAENGVWGDPVIVADDSNHFYFFHLSDPEGTNWKSEHILDRIVVQRSDDFGASFPHESYLGHNRPKKQDKPWAVVSPTSQELFCTWTEFDAYKSSAPEDKSRIRFSKSSPGGLEWTEAITISHFEGGCMDDAYTTEGAVPAVGTNQEVYVAWAWNEKIWLNRSLDNGATWEPQETPIADQVGGWKISIPGVPRANGFPVTVVDHSDGPYRGSIYVLFSDARNGTDNQDIFLVLSRDRGETWSEPIRVNNDTTERHQFFPWLTVDSKTGVLYAIFYDRRNHSDNQTDVYLASSTDGGHTWENERISEKPFLPFGDVFFGDYNNIAAVDGIIRPVWTRYDNKRLTIMTALINKKKTAK